MSSADGKYYPGIARDKGTFGTPAPDNPAKLVVTTSHPAAALTRKVAVYVRKDYVPGSVVPFIVEPRTGRDRMLFTTLLDGLISEHKLPVMIAISIGNGSGDLGGASADLSTTPCRAAMREFVEHEVLPLVEEKAQVVDARCRWAGDHGYGLRSLALIMAWFHPELYHRVLTYSGTYINQQWPYDPKTPQGAWGFHDHLIPESPRKPVRIWMEVGDQRSLQLA